MRSLLDFARRITGWQSQDDNMQSDHIIDCVFTRPEVLREPPKTLQELEAEAKIIAERDERLRKRDALPPETGERERTLSICGNNTFQNEVSEQNNCCLFKLPLEIREMIYAELLPFERVWIVIIDRRLVCDWEIVQTSIPQPDPNGHLQVDNLNTESLEELSVSPFRKSRQSPLRFRLGFTPKAPIWGLGILPFLQTCRRVYSEFMPYLYSKPTFAFHDTIPFALFVASIPPSHFQHIRSVTINMSASGLPRYLKARLRKSKSPIVANPRPDVAGVSYGFLHHGWFLAPLYNASVLLANASLGWNAIIHALQQMKSLRKVRITLEQVPRQIIVVGRENAVDRRMNEREIMDSLEWIGRARPWKGEIDDSEKRFGTEVVFENVWSEDYGENKEQGYWVRKVAENGEVEWSEVGEAAGKVVKLDYTLLGVGTTVLQ